MNNIDNVKLSFFDKVLFKMKMIYYSIVNKEYNYIIKDDNFLIDLKNKTITIDGEFSIHSTGNMKLSSDKHLIFKSGVNTNGSEGFIFFNSLEDQEGNPIIEKPLESQKILYTCD